MANNYKLPLIANNTYIMQCRMYIYIYIFVTYVQNDWFAVWLRSVGCLEDREKLIKTMQRVYVVRLNIGGWCKPIFTSENSGIR